MLSLQLPAQFIIVFEPVTHSAHFIDVQGEPTRERQQLSLIYNKAACADRHHRPCGPGRCGCRSTTRPACGCLPSVFIAADALHHLLGKRKPFLTAKRMLSNQTFRDVFKADNLNIDQRLKITSLTFLFTDLKGSTALYERVGDLAAFDLVRAHFHALLEIIAVGEGRGGEDHRRRRDGDLHQAGTCARRGLADARGDGRAQRRARHRGPRSSRSASTKGPCLAVMLNERQDYFGQTVNIAARVQSLSTSQEIHITGPVIDAPAVATILEKEAIKPIQKQAALRGIADKMVVYEIP